MTTFNDTLKNCAPVARPQRIQQHKLRSPSQMGTALTGRETIEVACCFDEQRNHLGNYSGVDIYLVDKALQNHPVLQGKIRSVEFRCYVDTEGHSGLVYRKVPTGSGQANSWSTSSEKALKRCAERWGQINANHDKNQYEYEPLAQQPTGPAKLPDLQSTMAEAFEDYVINSEDHPLIRKLSTPPVTRIADAAQDEIDDLDSVEISEEDMSAYE